MSHALILYAGVVAGGITAFVIVAVWVATPSLFRGSLPDHGAQRGQ